MIFTGRYVEDLSFFFVIRPNKEEAPKALQQQVIKEVAGTPKNCITVERLGATKEENLKGNLRQLRNKLLGTKINTYAPYIPRNNAVAERYFDNVISVARSLLLGAPHLPNQATVWAEAVETAVCTFGTAHQLKRWTVKLLWRQ